MAMKEPESRVSGAKLDHHIATSWNQNSVFSWSGCIDCYVWFVAISPGNGGARYVVSVVELNLTGF